MSKFWQTVGIVLSALLVLCIMPTASANPIPEDCKWRWYTQRLDHFRWSHETPTFEQRYFICDAHWKHKGPIFFYAGNEGPLEGYLQSAGLMFENAPKFGALVLFAEVCTWVHGHACLNVLKALRQAMDSACGTNKITMPGSADIGYSAP